VRRALSWLIIALCVACDEGGSARPRTDAGADAGDPCNACPDPMDPRVHYLHGNPNDCIGVVLMCTADQNGFQGACGCGCIDKGDPMCPACDDPSIDWISMDPSECSVEPPACPQGQQGFSNTCGCGCKLPGG
jgi:hypothetical protein